MSAAEGGDRIPKSAFEGLVREHIVDVLTRKAGLQLKLSISANGTARAVASTVYGEMYAMESFVQLIGPDGEVRHSAIFIRDAPQYR